MATEQPAKAPVTTEIEPAGPNKTDEKPSTPEVEYDSRRSKFLLAIDRADVIEIAEQLCLGVHVDCVQTLTGNRPLHLATTETIMYLILDNSENMNPRNKLQQTPMHTAILHRRKRCVEALIESKADIEPCDIKRRSPLVLASSMDDTFDIVKSLLDAGARVDAMSNNNETPLHLACKRGDTEMAKLLLDAKADLEATDRDGNLPIHVSAHVADLETVQLLIQRGSVVKVRNRWQCTPFDLAFISCSSVICKTLTQAAEARKQKKEAKHKGGNEKEPVTS